MFQRIAFTSCSKFKAIPDGEIEGAILVTFEIFKLRGQPQDVSEIDQKPGRIFGGH